MSHCIIECVYVDKIARDSAFTCEVLRLWCLAVREWQCVLPSSASSWESSSPALCRARPRASSWSTTTAVERRWRRVTLRLTRRACSEAEVRPVTRPTGARRQRATACRARRGRWRADVAVWRRDSAATWRSWWAAACRSVSRRLTASDRHSPVYRCFSAAGRGGSCLATCRGTGSPSAAETAPTNVSTTSVERKFLSYT